MMYHETVALDRVVVKAWIGIGFFGDSSGSSINQPVIVVKYFF